MNEYNVYNKWTLSSVLVSASPVHFTWTCQPLPFIASLSLPICTLARPFDGEAHFSKR